MATSNIGDLLARRNAKQEQRQKPAPQKGTVMEVDGDVPEMFAKIGDVVLLTWGDPKLIDGPVMDVAMFVTLADPKTGRVNGQMITDPTMQGMDQATGRAVALPPMVPMGNVPYSATPRGMTWRHREVK